MDNYHVVQEGDTFVFISDKDNGISITNSAERVLKDIAVNTGSLVGRRVFYQDTSGDLGEICHNKGIFLGFAPATAIDIWELIHDSLGDYF